jgi:hypothetical protein
MSGSSNDTSGTGGGDGKTVCENLEFTTVLRSPQEEQVQHLKVGAVLDVVYDGGPILAVVPDSGAPVGSINWSGIDRLIECIRQDFGYAARVLSIDGGQVRIRVAPVRG